MLPTLTYSSNQTCDFYATVKPVFFVFFLFFFWGGGGGGGEAGGFYATVKPVVVFTWRGEQQRETEKHAIIYHSNGNSFFV